MSAQSWRSLPRPQDPLWPDPDRVRSTLDLLSTAEPIVEPSEIDELSALVESARAGNHFIIQGGDCAETFATTTEAHLVSLAQTLSGMAKIIDGSTNRGAVRIARSAGQYCKPRSNLTDPETDLPVWRGDLVNARKPGRAARRPEPMRMIAGYFHARAAREHLGPGIFVSHEFLLLEYEQAFIREALGRQLDLSTHLPWVGDRTRHPQHAHIALASTLDGPLAVKLGPSTTPQDVIDLADALRASDRRSGVILTPRLGVDNVQALLPPLVQAARQSGAKVTWMCDPMHGNTVDLHNGFRTRAMDAIISELAEFIAIVRSHGYEPAGMHLELTGEDVTECVGGRQGITTSDVPTRFTSAMDPRLNATQALEVAGVVAELLN